MKNEENINEKFSKASKEEFNQFAEPKYAIKEKLDQRFVQHYGTSKVVQMANFPIALWKVAATWILLIAGAGTYVLGSSNSAETSSVLVKTDTVFVEKKMIAVVDTASEPVAQDVVVAKTSSSSKSIFKKESMYKPSKGKSLAEDSLARSFFVSLM